MKSTLAILLIMLFVGCSSSSTDVKNLKEQKPTGIKSTIAPSRTNLK